MGFFCVSLLALLLCVPRLRVFLLLSRVAVNFLLEVGLPFSRVLLQGWLHSGDGAAY